MIEVLVQWLRWQLELRSGDGVCLHEALHEALHDALCNGVVHVAELHRSGGVGNAGAESLGNRCVEVVWVGRQSRPIDQEPAGENFGEREGDRLEP